MKGERDLLPPVAAALLAVPYLTLSLPYRTALMVQAAVVLLVTLLPAAAGLAAAGGGRRLQTTSDALGRGALLWLAAALLGVAGGLAAGNDLQRLAGQLLALLLLPLGLAAGRLAPAGAARLRRFSLSLAAVAGVACLLHFAVWIAGALRDVPVRRLYLENKVSVTGALPMVLVLLVAVRPSGRWRHLLAAVFVVYLAGAGSRGAWLAAVLGAGLLWSLAGGLRRPHGKTWRAALVLGAAVTAAWLGFSLWLGLERRNELPSSVPQELLGERRESSGLRLASGGAASWDSDLRQRMLSYGFAVEPDTTYRLRARFRGGSEGRCYAALRWLDAAGQVLGRFSVEGRFGASPEVSEGFDRSPPGAVTGILMVGARAGAAGTWQLESIELEAMGPAFLAPPVRQLVYLRGRVLSRSAWSALAEAIAGDGSAGDAAANVDEDVGSVEFRLAESAELWRRFSAAGPGRKLWGHGLGATFRLGGEELNYVHNLYAFLLFKLGLVGGALLLAAAAVWMLDLLRRLRNRVPGSEKRRAIAAVAAVWLAYLAWGLTSPEIIDFRLAPLFGMLLSALPADGELTAEAAAERVL